MNTDRDWIVPTTPSPADEWLPWQAARSRRCPFDGLDSTSRGELDIFLLEYYKGKTETRYMNSLQHVSETRHMTLS